jgi:hypothetical protein
MNLLTINNENLVGYNTYLFIKHYANMSGYTVDDQMEGHLVIYEQYFPFQMLEVLVKRSKKDFNIYINDRINNLYKLSLNKLERTKDIYFIYPFTFYSKYDYDFNFLEILKEKIQNRFKKNVIFILNNHFEDETFKHFNIFRYDIYHHAKENKKIKNTEDKKKKFISLNLKKRKNREDLFDFINQNDLLDQFHYSYLERNINLWQTNDYSTFAKKYLNNDNGSGHFAMEYYLKDDFFNTFNGKYFDEAFYYIITETTCDDRICFMTEKTYKSFYHKIPFIIFGTPHVLKNLKKEGFKTFNKWIDESYDDEFDYEKRKKIIFSEIVRLNNLDFKTHKLIINEMHETLEYNHKHFLNVSNFKNDFLKLFQKE